MRVVSLKTPLRVHERDPDANLALRVEAQWRRSSFEPYQDQGGLRGQALANSRSILSLRS
jgi:hypothetical protein